MAKKDKRFKYQAGEERPVTISLRIPQELYDRLEGYRKRYPETHRPSVSELVRDGIEMRLEVEADPRSNRAGSTTEDMEFQIDGASILRDMQATLARHDSQMQAIMQAIERQTTAAGNGSAGVSYHVIHSNTDLKDKADKATITARIHQLRDQGLSYAQIAAQLQADGIPTTSGRGAWAKGNVERILSGRKTAVKSEAP